MIDHDAKIVLSRSQLHLALNLPADVEVTGFHTTWDPQFLHVLLNGDRIRHERLMGNPGDVELPTLRHGMTSEGWVVYW